ncbi:MAG: hypothetical protein Homavirus6_5 [Homavirus sp.]|uniref:Transmembrane protein n=1 Tax=Homavirus sp. TaxID=2487769 RepID=A0A3G5A6H5_9VIRU|nr:MAG: hypothetical protein Homavirus6_5 [Homavirus sp.]
MLNITVGKVSHVYGGLTDVQLDDYYNIMSSYHLLWYFILCRRDIVIILSALMGALYEIPFRRVTLVYPITTIFNAILAGFVCYIGGNFVVGMIPFPLRGLMSLLLIMSIIFSKYYEVRNVLKYMFGELDGSDRSDRSTRQTYKNVTWNLTREPTCVCDTDSRPRCRCNCAFECQCNHQQYTHEHTFGLGHKSGYHCNTNDLSDNEKICKYLVKESRNEPENEVQNKSEYISNNSSDNLSKNEFDSENESESNNEPKTETNINGNQIDDIMMSTDTN